MEMANAAATQTSTLCKYLLCSKMYGGIAVFKSFMLLLVAFEEDTKILACQYFLKLFHDWVPFHLFKVLTSVVKSGTPLLNWILTMLNMML